VNGLVDLDHKDFERELTHVYVMRWYPERSGEQMLLSQSLIDDIALLIVIFSIVVISLSS
jgi:hypothetical protein